MTVFPRLLPTIVATLLVGSALAVVAVSRPARDTSAAPASSFAPAGAPQRVPVIVELFTSEGCSNCPPADEVLTRLASEQPVENAVIIPLSEHVDYWDRLGWRDPFSSATFSARQSEYDRQKFLTGSIYTPQMVVDGAAQFVGSDYRRAEAAIGNAARQPKVPLHLSIEGRVQAGSPASLHVGLRAPEGISSLGPVVVMLAVTEDGLTTDVARGENGGRNLHHNAVVRSLTQVGAVNKSSKPWSTGVTLPIAANWQTNRLHIVAFAQTQRSHQIVAATSQPIGG